MASAAAAPVAPTQIIDDFDSSLLDVMKDADQLGFEGRYQRLAPVIGRTFDIPLMTRIVVGAQWSDWTDSQRQAVIDAFAKFIISTYARRFDGYGGEAFEEDGAKPISTGVVVMTKIMRPNDQPVAINYLMRQSASGDWRAADVFLTGSISELATRRSEFGAVLEREGYDGLLAALAAKAMPEAEP
jgi:phospholipid transport system substrate-binding protein